MTGRTAVVALAALLLMGSGCLQEEPGLSPSTSSTIGALPDPFLEAGSDEGAATSEETGMPERNHPPMTSTTPMAETSLSTTLAAPDPDTCAHHCWKQGYEDGVCRLSGRHCNDAVGEVYDARGNRWCRLEQRGQKALDSCCCVRAKP